MLEDWLTISGNLPNVGLRIEKTRLGWWDPIIPIGHPIIGGHEKISSTRGNKNKDFLRKNQVFLLDWPAGSASVSIWKITLVPADRGSIFTQLCWTCWRYPLVMTNIAMGNGPCIDGLPIKNGDSPVVGMIQCDFHIFQGVETTNQCSLLTCYLGTVICSSRGSRIQELAAIIFLGRQDLEHNSSKCWSSASCFWPVLRGAVLS